MQALVAPDSFKEALDATATAAALAQGLRGIGASDRCDICPLADGGEGSGTVLATALGLLEHRATVHDPRGRSRTARWWRAPDGHLAVVELAEASGLSLVPTAARDAGAASSFGTGELLAAARNSGCREVWLCAGGSATVDGGAGCLQALGWRFLDAGGVAITQPLCGQLLTSVHDIVSPSSPADVRMRVLCDVTNPLLGPNGAARVFAPQKGADAAEVEALDAGLTHWAELLCRTTGCDVARLARGGAAGGIAAGLYAALAAELVSGFDLVAGAVRLDERIARADVVLTGEGRLDAQTARGKVVGEVARRATGHNVPVVAFVGAVQGGPHHAGELAHALGLADVRIITPSGMSLGTARAQTARLLRTAATEWRRTWSHTGH